MIFLRLIGSDKTQRSELLFTKTILDTAMQNVKFHIDFHT